MKIYVKDNDISKALRILKKKMLKEGDIKGLRSKQYFVSKGEEKRLAKKAGVKRWAKKQVQLAKDKERAEREAFRQRKKAAALRKKQYNARKARD